MLKRKYFQEIAGFDYDDSSDDGEDDTKDVDGVWVSKYSLSGPRRLFAHYICALRSPKVRKSGNIWYNVRKEISRGNCFSCFKCSKRGASIGCFETRCAVIMHYHCAVTAGYCYFRFKDKYFLCEEHSKVVEEKDAAQDAEMPVDISAGQEAIRIDYANTLDQAHPLDNGWRYVSKNLDSADVDLCDDVNVCECLANGKNYNYKGEVIPYPQPTRLIMECNIRCGCHARRCTNRVVQSGLTKRLQIYRVRGALPVVYDHQLFSPPSKNAAVSQWAVRTLDRINVNGFVCEMAGQFVLRDSGEPGLHVVSEWRKSDPQSSNSSKEEGSELFAQDDQSLSEFFNGRLCVDVRHFGNVATFIRDSRKQTGLESNLVM
eukprot:gene25923-31306_t